MAEIRYANQGATRSLPLDPQLERILIAAADAAGIDTIVVNSGGQTADRDPSRQNQPGGWTGTTAHNDGHAGDIMLVAGGRTLDFSNPADQAIFSNFVTAARQNGAGGFGAGTNYMGNSTIHVDIGNPRTWGARNPDGSWGAAPGWLNTAFNAGAGQTAMAYSPTPPAPIPGGATQAATQQAQNQPLLRLGSNGQAVRDWQQFLIDQGYDLGTYGADGIFGNLTDAATRAYQRDRGLSMVDGVVGGQTRGAMQQDLAAPPSALDRFRDAAGTLSDRLEQFRQARAKGANLREAFRAATGLAQGAPGPARNFVNAVRDGVPIRDAAGKVANDWRAAQNQRQMAAIPPTSKDTLPPLPTPSPNRYAPVPSAPQAVTRGDLPPPTYNTGTATPPPTLAGYDSTSNANPVRNDPDAYGTLGGGSPFGEGSTYPLSRANQRLAAGYSSGTVTIPPTLDAFGMSPNSPPTGPSTYPLSRANQRLAPGYSSGSVMIPPGSDYFGSAPSPLAVGSTQNTPPPLLGEAKTTTAQETQYMYDTQGLEWDDAVGDWVPARTRKKDAYAISKPTVVTGMKA